MQYNLVKIVKLTYYEGTHTAEYIWADFATNSTIANLRNEFNADLCFLVFNSSSYTGYAKIPPNDDPNSSTSNIGFAVGNISKVKKIFTLAHETGHNFGAHHDVDHDPGAYYNNGYIAPKNAWGRIMSYVVDPENKRLNIWSNPNKNHNGIPTGNTNANNDQWLNEQKQDIANYRKPLLPGILTYSQILVGRTYQLTGNVYIPSSKYLKITSSAKLNLTDYYVKSTGGTIIVENGVTNYFVKLKSGSTIKALYTTV